MAAMRPPRAACRRRDVHQRAVAVEIFGTGHTAGEYEPVGLGEVDTGQHLVGYGCDAVGAGHLALLVYRYYGDLHTCAAQYIDCGQGLDFLEAGGQEEI